MIITEVRKLNNEELYEKLSKLQVQVFTINLNKKLKSDQLMKRKMIKKDIARLMMVINEKKIGKNYV